MTVPKVPDEREADDGRRAEARPRDERTPPRWGPVRVRRVGGDRRWWPMPLWLWAVVIAVLTALTILVVGALGGHWAVVQSITHDQSRPVCPNGFPTTEPLTRRPDGGCSPWQQWYVLGGIGAWLMIVIYRWTIGRHVPGRRGR